MDELEAEEEDEINAARLEDQRERNALLLKEMTKRVIERIEQKIEECPLMFRVILAQLWEETELKFPTMGLVHVGGFFFLRFVCPFLATGLSSATGPFGSTPLPMCCESENCPSTRRSMILLSKVLQNLSNQVRFLLLIS